MLFRSILIEFLEAFYRGKTYTPPRMEEETKRRAERLGISREDLEKHLQPNEYQSSAQLFRDFLTSHEPFRQEFTPALANTFYTNIRCGLLHEAATKGATGIKNQQGSSLIQALPGGDLVLFRTNFQTAINAFISTYKEELLTSKERKEAFIRKMDDLCQMRRVQYFAYGSNMYLKQMNDRASLIYCKSTGFIRNYAFHYNKKSDDGSSKANIVRSADDLTYGVCFEIDEDGFSKVRKKEKGYSETEIAFYTNEGDMIIVKSFISGSISDAAPSEEYMNTIIKGAIENAIPEEYINRVLTFKFN